MKKKRSSLLPNTRAPILYKKKSYRDFQETGPSSHFLYLANLFSLQGSTTNS